MEFRLLGTVSVDTFTGPLPLGPAKRRSLLAALLLSANTPVSIARLTDSLWDDTPPLHARSVIQGHVSRLRALLVGADAEAYGVELVTLGDAYVLRLPETLLDSQRFEELLTLARGQRSPRRRGADAQGGPVPVAGAGAQWRVRRTAAPGRRALAGGVAAGDRRATGARLRGAGGAQPGGVGAAGGGRRASDAGVAGGGPDDGAVPGGASVGGAGLVPPYAAAARR